jgi:hypothetical protein
MFGIEAIRDTDASTSNREHPERMITATVSHQVATPVKIPANWISVVHTDARSRLTAQTRSH